MAEKRIALVDVVLHRGGEDFRRVKKGEVYEFTAQEIAEMSPKYIGPAPAFKEAVRAAPVADASEVRDAPATALPANPAAVLARTIAPAKG